MGKKLIKTGALLAAGGSLVAFGGCLGLGGKKGLGFVLRDAALSAAYEFVFDNDSFVDLFQDDFGTGTQYDDRFVDAPTRIEPTDDAQNALDNLLNR